MTVVTRRSLVDIGGSMISTDSQMLCNNTAFEESCVAVETPTENSGTDTSDATLLINGKTQVVTNQVER